MEDTIPGVSPTENGDTELRAELDRVSQEKRALVEELKSEKAKRRETPDAGSVEQVVAQALEAQRKKDADANRQKALELFQQRNKEFHPDNDTGGLRLALLNKELQDFKQDGKFSVDDFYSLFDKAKRTISPSSAPSDTVSVRPSAEIPDGTSTPRSTEPSKLSEKEQSLVRKMGWTEERFLAVKSKQPFFVADLLAKHVI